jgi:hypothetical protein
MTVFLKKMRLTTILCISFQKTNKSVLFNEFMKKFDFLNISRYWSKEAIYVLKVGLQIMSSASLVRIYSCNQTSNSYVKSSIKLNFNQSANANLLPQKRCVFWLYLCYFKVVTLFISNFRIGLPYLLFIRRYHLRYPYGTPTFSQKDLDTMNIAVVMVSKLISG